jgi:hypothetical protein
MPALRSLLAQVLLAGAALAQSPSGAIVWEIDNLRRIGGHEVTVVGSPRVVDAPQGRGVEFDGVDDALFLPIHPLAGQAQFTAEVTFRPAAEGPKEQRFFHLQETGSENRVLFETRLTDDGHWFLDTFIKSDGGECTLFAKDHLHKIGPWVHAAIVVDGKTMRHYVNGKLELSQELKFTAHKAGNTSLGVRYNKVHWYKGAMSRARFTPRPLEPSEFWKP